jgi:hypothetical protein
MNLNPAARQKGVFTIISTLGVISLLLFVGMVVDAGRVMLVHAELQGAADACALAAAAELNNSSDGSASARAEQAGRKVVQHWWRQNFQSESIDSAGIDIRWSSALNGAYSTTASANARVIQCRISYLGLTSVLMKLADVTNLLPQAVARAGLVPGGQVCALPLALRNQVYTVGTSYTLTPYLQLAELSGGALQSDSIYTAQITNWGDCMVNTVPHSVTLGALSSAFTTALQTRYANDPELGSVAGTTARRVLAVPVVDTATNITDRRWACLELLGGGNFKFLGYANDGTFVPPSATKPWCVASGLPLGVHKVGAVTYATGPFVPGLLQ